MSIAESQRTKLLELRVAELERRLDAMTSTAQAAGYAVEELANPYQGGAQMAFKRGPGRPPKVKDGNPVN